MNDHGKIFRQLLPGILLRIAEQIDQTSGQPLGVQITQEMPEFILQRDTQLRLCAADQRLHNADKILVEEPLQPIPTP